MGVIKTGKPWRFFFLFLFQFSGSQEEAESNQKKDLQGKEKNSYRIRRQSARSDEDELSC